MLHHFELPADAGDRISGPEGIDGVHQRRIVAVIVERDADVALAVGGALDAAELVEQRERAAAAAGLLAIDADIEAIVARRLDQGEPGRVRPAPVDAVQHMVGDLAGPAMMLPDLVEDAADAAHRPCPRQAALSRPP